MYLSVTKASWTSALTCPLILDIATAIVDMSFMFQIQERTGEQSIDINGKVYRAMEFGQLWGGISYRNSFDGAEYLNGVDVANQKLQYLTPVIGINVNKFVFAYTYTQQMGNVKFDSGGFHQITLGLNFLGGRAEPYDCNCPAIN